MMKILTLQDALEYQKELLEKWIKSGKASERNLTMTQYTIEIIDSRIRDKESKNDTRTGTLHQKTNWEIDSLFPIPAKHD